MRHATSLHRVVRFMVLGAASAWMAVCAATALAQQKGHVEFDHLRTGFPLTGVHAVTPCERCHVGGQMAATPTNCDYCHRTGSRIAATVMPARHIPTAEPCDNCHRSAVTWAGARFSHVAVAPGTCLTCHNGSVTNGKPGGHVATTQSCDVCHRTLAWLPAGYDHTGVVAGTCGNCHRPGGSGLAEPTNHIPYASQLLNGSSMSCDSCHLSTTTFTSEKMNHNGSLGNGSGWCKACHQSGTSYLGSMQKRSLTHQSSSGVTDCSQSGCHRPLGNQGSTYSSW